MTRYEVTWASALGSAKRLVRYLEMKPRPPTFVICMEAFALLRRAWALDPTSMSGLFGDWMGKKTRRDAGICEEPNCQADVVTEHHCQACDEALERLAAEAETPDTET